MELYRINIYLNIILILIKKYYNNNKLIKTILLKKKILILKIMICIVMQIQMIRLELNTKH